MIMAYDLINQLHRLNRDSGTIDWYNGLMWPPHRSHVVPGLGVAV